MDASFSPGGYDYSYVEENLERFICNFICTKILRDPHITSCCGQVFCESCLNYWFTEHGIESCPFCRAVGKEFQHFLDKRLKREVDSLRIYCPNKEEGCQWVGEAGSLKHHLESIKGCDYAEVECPNKCCGFYLFSGTRRIKRKDLENHLKNCYFRLYRCEYCGDINTYAVITGDSHYIMCPEYPINCPNWPQCDGKDIKRKDLWIHLNECPEQTIECPYKCKVPALRKMPRYGSYPVNEESYTSLEEPSSLTVHVEATFTLKRKYLTQHTSECEFRPYKCEDCGEESTYDYIVRHRRSRCPEIRRDCPNKCGVKDILGKNMEDHRSQCPEEPVQCPFTEAGCKKKLVRREFVQHISTTQAQHLWIVSEAYKKVKKVNEELRKDNAEIKRVCIGLQAAKHLKLTLCDLNKQSENETN